MYTEGIEATPWPNLLGWVVTEIITHKITAAFLLAKDLALIPAGQ